MRSTETDSMLPRSNMTSDHDELRSMMTCSRNSRWPSLIPVIFMVLVIDLCLLLGLWLWAPWYHSKQQHDQAATAMSPLVNLLSLHRTDTTDHQCHDVPTFSIVREFFQSTETASRSAEIISALSQSMQNNKCARFVLVISDSEYLSAIASLQVQYDVNVDVWWSPVPITYDLLLLAIQKTDPQGLFVLSTADVSIPDPVPLISICPSVFSTNTSLLAVSRRDPLPTGLQCHDYKYLGSADVFIGNASMIDDYVLRNTRFSPSYWGVENVVMWVLLRGRQSLYNLCPWYDVVHYHTTRTSKSSSERIRISHQDNSMGDWSDISQVCDMETLQKQYPPYAYQST